MSVPIVYSAVLLTAVNLFFRLLGTAFQVFISARLGAEGVGVLQLVLSLGMMATTVATAGIRTATMYMTAEEVGKRQTGTLPWVLHSSFLYSLLMSCTTAIFLYLFSDTIVTAWIGSPSAAPSVRLLCFSLPVNCLCGVMSGYYTANKRIGTLAAIEVCEQLLAIGISIGLLLFWAGEDSAKACQSIIFGSTAGCCISLLWLSLLLYRKHRNLSPPISLRKRILNTAVPLALADDLKSGISTAENMMVPRRLALFPSVMSPLAVFGIVCGMVFPILMFPAAILYGLAELLIPELARCNAAGSKARIEYLSRRSLRLSLVYGAICGGLLYLCSDTLCYSLYKSREAGVYLSKFAFLAPMLYCDAITDAMTKGLGQQKACVRYNILTSSLDLLFLYLLLPQYGMAGYFFSFLLTHLLNFLLSLRRLLKITGKVIDPAAILGTLFSMLFALWCVSFLKALPARCICFMLVFICTLYLERILSREDLNWIKGLLHTK